MATASASVTLSSSAALASLNSAAGSNLRRGPLLVQLALLARPLSPRGRRAARRERGRGPVGCSMMAGLTQGRCIAACEPLRATISIPSYDSTPILPPSFLFLLRCHYHANGKLSAVWQRRASPRMAARVTRVAPAGVGTGCTPSAPPYVSCAVFCMSCNLRHRWHHNDLGLHDQGRGGRRTRRRSLRAKRDVYRSGGHDSAARSFEKFTMPHGRCG